MTTPTESTGNAALLRKLDELQQRAQELTESMNDPKVASNAARVVQIGKELGRLRRVLDPYQDYLRLRRQAGETRALLADPGAEAELKELAEQELADLAERGGPRR